METGTCFWKNPSANIPIIQRPLISGFGLFPRAKVVRMFFKSKEKNDVTDFSRLLRRVTSGVTDFFRNKIRSFQT